MATKISTIPPKRLSETITAAATSFKLNDILGFDGVALSSSIVGDVLYASFQDTTGTILELMKIDPTTIASASITILKRGLSFNEDGTETEVAGNKRQWIKNQTIVNLGTNTPAMFNLYVKTADNQTVAGVKTFSSSPIVPTPTTDMQASTKKYVDDGLALKLDDSQIDTDATLTANSDTKVASQKATKAYALPKTGGTMTGPIILNTNTPSADLEAASKKYVDDTNNQGAADSSTTTKGIGKVSVAPVSATDPIFVGDNDPRVPTQSENDALVGTGTPSSSNKYVTADTLLAEKYCGDGSDGNITISSPTTLTRDMYYNNLTVTSTLTTAGYKIFVNGTLSGAGTIDWGTASAGNAGLNGGNVGTGGAGGGSTGSGQFVSVAGGLGGSAGNSPTAGSNGGNSTSCIGAAGSNGGAAGAAGGTGGTSTIQTKFGVFSSPVLLGLDYKKDGTFIPVQNSGGAAGGGGANRNGWGDVAGGGGGGGASGGIVFIVANVWAGTFTIKSNGGAGGAGGNGLGTNGTGGGGGGGGNGGSTVVVYNTKTWTGSYNIAAGAAGAAGTGTAGNGTAGTAGTAGISYELQLKTLTR